MDKIDQISGSQRRVSDTWTGALSPPENIPSSAEVVIIGGGIIGVSTAWFLAKRGVNVVLCEKGHIAGEQSGRNWGWVRQQGRDPRELPMMIDSLNLYENLDKEIGEDVGFSRGGCLYMADTDQEVEDYHDWLKVAQQFDLDSEILDKDRLKREVVLPQETWVGALYTPSDGRAEPHKVTPAIARAAAREGAHIMSACAVRGVESEAGRVSSVVTEHGSIKTTTVLCAAGAWTSTFCRSLGISVPQLQTRGTVARTSPGKKVISGTLFCDRLGIRRRDDGGYTLANATIMEHTIKPTTFKYATKFFPLFLQEASSLKLRFNADFFKDLISPTNWDLEKISPFEKMRVLDPETKPADINNIQQNFTSVFPELSDLSIVETWSGMVEASPDVVPIIDEIDDMPGFYVATGFSGHGFGIGPGAGKAIAEMLVNDPSAINLRPFRLGRFFDGTPIRPSGSI